MLGVYLKVCERHDENLSIQKIPFTRASNFKACIFIQLYLVRIYSVRKRHFYKRLEFLQGTSIKTQIFHYTTKCYIFPNSKLQKTKLKQGLLLRKTDVEKPESKFDTQMRLIYFEVSNFKTNIKCVIKFWKTENLKIEL